MPASDKDGKARAAKEAARAAEAKRELAATAAANKAAKADEESRKQETASRIARAAAKAAEDNKGREAKAASDRREKEAANRAAKAAADRREQEAVNRAAENRREQEAANRAAKAAADRREQEAVNRANKVNTPPATSAPAKAAPVESAPIKSAPRDPGLMDRYKEAQKRIAGLQPGTEAYDRNLKILQDIGGQYGLNWQQWVPGWEKGDPNPPPAGTIPPPETAPPGGTPPGAIPPGETPPETAPPGAAIPGAEIPGAETPGGSALGPPAPTYYNQQPIAKQDDLVNTGAGQAIYDMAGDVTEWDPGSFDSQMDAAYDNVYNRFQRRNQEEFSRQNDEFSQIAANRGLDPNSGAYRAMYKQLADRQDNARQEAQSAATDAAYAVQKQGFEQYKTGQLMPGEVAGQFAGIYGQGFAQRAETARQTQGERYGMNLQQGSLAAEAARQTQGERHGMDLQQQAQEAAAIAARKQFENQRRLDKLNYDAMLARQKIASAGGKDGPSAYDDELERQRREGASNGGGSSPMNDFTTGLVGGAGGALTQGLNKKTY